MRKLQQQMIVWSTQSSTRVATTIIALIVFLTLGTVRADITNVIWKADFSGTLAIQKYDAQLVPGISVTKFSNRDFLTMVGANTATTGNEVLGVNLDLTGGKTNFYLSVYDQASRQNSLRISTNETATMISDGKNLIFSVEAPLLPTKSTWGGGIIRIAGTGKMVKGIPSSLQGTVGGIFIDTRPGDLNGTTGLVLRAKISTSKSPLRVQPSN